MSSLRSGQVDGGCQGKSLIAFKSTLTDKLKVKYYYDQLWLLCCRGSIFTLSICRTSGFIACQNDAAAGERSGRFHAVRDFCMYLIMFGHINYARLAYFMFLSFETCFH